MCICNYASIFGLKNQNAKNEYISFYKKLDMFLCMIISCKCDSHLGPQIPSLMNTNNQPNGQKNGFFPYSPFGMNYVIFKFFCTMYDLIKCI